MSGKDLARAGGVAREPAPAGGGAGARDGAAGVRAARGRRVRGPPSRRPRRALVAARRRRRRPAPGPDHAAQRRLRRAARGPDAVGRPRPDLDADRGVERSTAELDLPALGPERPSGVASLFRSGREAVLQGWAQAELVAAGGARRARRVARRCSRGRPEDASRRHRPSDLCGAASRQSRLRALF